MLKKTILSLSLIFGLFLVATQVNAQCGPSEVAIINEGPCEKTVTIDYGKPCVVLGSITMFVPPGPGSITCVPIPMGYMAIHITVTDLSTGNSSTVDNPACGPNQMGMHMACEGMCNIIQYEGDWQVMILPD